MLCIYSNKYNRRSARYVYIVCIALHIALGTTEFVYLRSKQPMTAALRKSVYLAEDGKTLIRSQTGMSWHAMSDMARAQLRATDLAYTKTHSTRTNVSRFIASTLSCTAAP